MPSTPFVTPTASNQPLNAALMALSSPALGYAASIPSVHQAGIFFQPSHYLLHMDLLLKIFQILPQSNLAQCAPAHTVCSLDQSCVIDTSLHEEPLKEGRFGPIGSAIPPGKSLKETTTVCQQLHRNS
ncbi:hypothetical protein KIN20_021579 [Parelaphostrongylus tenuis]|uniref:Uncharacterized protein n=1 Tax=Parelaphostrongylus tenuis TaxID=148309 RepID=A0AAD5N777_PARTN|nr:hypothetical protein KIN20_021579 [Parelaphostrongylus tenuis]